MLANVLSSAVIGIDAHVVEVEVDIARGLPYFSMVGLPEVSVRESKERVRAAIKNSGYNFPSDRITVNLAPADIKKEGTGFDLPIALGVLSATGLIPQDILGRYLILGELSLDGRVKGVTGSLPMAIAAEKSGHAGILVPYENRHEAAVVQGIPVFPLKTLAQAVDFFLGACPIPPEKIDLKPMFEKSRSLAEDFSEVMGQAHVKRAMEVAAAASHNLLMIGPPGSGKTMLARRLPTILPPLRFSEAIETTKVFSVAGLLKNNQALVTARPFRAPHHTISDAGMIGGGRIPRPGEVSLAHNGVLFLDELPEFKKHVLEVLRQPMEDKTVIISRALSTIAYPSSFMLVAAMNPCPCGYYADPTHECLCSHQQLVNYRARISGPLLDRIDIHVEVPAVPYKTLTQTVSPEPSAVIQKRVAAARSVQSRRFEGTKIYCNANMSGRHIRKHCRINPRSASLLESAIDNLGLTARAYNRILKISRTIADLAGDADIQTRHVSEAIQYRTRK